MNKIEIKNDTYHMNTVGDKIIVNKKYEGIMIFDLELNLLEKMYIEENFCIYNSLALNSKEILFCCLENIKYVIINVETNENKSFEIPSILEDTILKEVLETNGNSVILRAYDNSVWEFSLKSYVFKNVIYNNFFKKNTEIQKYNDSICFCELEDTFSYMYEKKIVVIQDGFERSIYPEKSYIFYGMKLISKNNTNRIITLSVSIEDEEKSSISIIDL